MNRKSHFRCTATGDAMITRRLPAEGEYDGFAAVRDFIRQADFRFGNGGGGISTSAVKPCSSVERSFTLPRGPA